MSDVWAAGDAYEPFIGRWSRLVAPAFLDWLSAPPAKRWLDVGCGTGALTSAILARCEPTMVTGIDPSDGFVAWTAAHVDDPRARFEVADATHLPPDCADIVVSGLVLNFVPDPAAAVRAMCAAAPAGTIAAYVWDYAGRMDLLRHFWDAAAALNPEADNLVEGVRFPLCNPAALADLWRHAGLVDVATDAVDVPTLFADFDDYWTPFLGGQGPAAGYAMSLSQERRAALRDRIRSGLPVGIDGS
ncbi:MAG: class I SAM-dependent methyltransferase, partial [Actinobacteria bacterium]|nr:class I SAM-dependent methyltransferase [Actinomycetota bacterium]